MLTLLFLSFVLPTCQGDPGVPGQEWSPELIRSVQYRLRRFWSYSSPFTKDFDLDQNAAKYQHFVYDPTSITVEPNCNLSSTNCQNWWGEYTRGNDIGNIQFLSIWCSFCTLGGAFKMICFNLTAFWSLVIRKKINFNRFSSSIFNKCCSLRSEDI